uniref:cytochrome c biogenesis CcdA family protein n=1 Tax=Nocardioides salarius TaxID=374513 RepID=UPI00355903DC
MQQRWRRAPKRAPWFARTAASSARKDPATSVRPRLTPRLSLAGAPLLGAVFAVGWTPCIGPALTAVLTLSTTSATAEGEPSCPSPMPRVSGCPSCSPPSR